MLVAEVHFRHMNRTTALQIAAGNMFRAVVQIGGDYSLGQDVGKVVNGNAFHVAGVCNVVLHELPTIRC